MKCPICGNLVTFKSTRKCRTKRAAHPKFYKSYRPQSGHPNTQPLCYKYPFKHILVIKTRGGICLEKAPEDFSRHVIFFPIQNIKV